MEPSWARARDVLAGEDAVKKAGVKYLPRLTEQTDDEYAAYTERGHFFPASGRTHSGMLGLIFRRDPDVKMPSDVEAFAEDITLTAQSLFGFAKEVTSEVIAVGRHGLLVDFDDAEKRPYVVGYKAEQIVNWRTVRRGGKKVLVLVVLKEEEVVPMSDGFADTRNTVYRVLKLDQPEGAKVASYKVLLYSRKVLPTGQPAATPEGAERAPTGAQAEAHEWNIVERVPTYRGTPLPFIPFTFVGVTKNDETPERPPLEDVITTNLSHWRNSADIEHGRHFTGLPTAWVAGFATTDAGGKPVSLKIGAGTAWISDNPQAKAGFLEFTGQGLKALDDALTQKKDEMAVLGARLLETQKRAAETAESMQIRSAGESSALSSIATTVGEALTATLNFMRYWVTGNVTTKPEELSVTLNTDYVAATLQPQEITALVAAWQSNAISHETLLWNLSQGEVLPPDITPEDEITRIQEEAPKLGGDALPLDEEGGVPGSQKAAQEAAAKKKAADDEAAAKLARDTLAAKNQPPGKK